MTYLVFMASWFLAGIIASLIYIVIAFSSMTHKVEILLYDEEPKGKGKILRIFIDSLMLFVLGYIGLAFILLMIYIVHEINKE